jgi:hypothetical protein
MMVHHCASCTQLAIHNIGVFMLDFVDIEIVNAVLVSSGFPAVLGSWERIKKAALESCQQSGEEPVQQRQQEIVASLNEALFSVTNGKIHTAEYYIKKALRQLLA